MKVAVRPTPSAEVARPSLRGSWGEIGELKKERLGWAQEWVGKGGGERGEASIWASGKLVVSPTGESDWKRVELILRGGKR